jgi:hypothetical protein
MAEKFYKPVNGDEENDGIHIAKIISAVPCGRHAADIGDACWNIGSRSGLLRAICDKRARSAGANGQVTPDTRSSAAPTRTYKNGNTR